MCDLAQMRDMTCRQDEPPCSLQSDLERLGDWSLGRLKPGSIHLGCGGRILTGINSSSQAAKEGRFILAEDGDAIYAAEFFESGWNCGLDEAGVRDSFRLILSNWAGD